jgi:hypothetical protein
MLWAVSLTKGRDEAHKYNLTTQIWCIKGLAWLGCRWFRYSLYETLISCLEHVRFGIRQCQAKGSSASTIAMVRGKVDGRSMSADPGCPIPWRRWLWTRALLHNAGLLWINPCPFVHIPRILKARTHLSSCCWHALTAYYCPGNHSVCTRHLYYKSKIKMGPWWCGNYDRRKLAECTLGGVYFAGYTERWVLSDVAATNEENVQSALWEGCTLPDIQRKLQRQYCTGTSGSNIPNL